MSYLEHLKEIIYQDSKYNFIFTDFTFALTSTHSKNNEITTEDIFTACLFLSPYHLCEIGIGIKRELKTWNVELIIKKRANLYLPDSYASNNGMNPTNFDIENEFFLLLNKNIFENTNFIKEPTLLETLEGLENYFVTLLQEKKIPYNQGEFSDKLMLLLVDNFNLKDSSVHSIIFAEKEKGILYKKLNNKLQDKIKQSHVNKI